jgi:hypothetical protein
VFAGTGDGMPAPAYPGSMSPSRPISRRRAVAWSAAIAVPVVVGAALLVPIAASGAVDLPDKSVAELLEFAAASDVDALSGTIEQTSALGLPDLGGLSGAMGDEDDEDAGGPSAADVDDLLSLITGSHTAKVYLDGEAARLQVLDRLGERNVYVDGDANEVWFVDSETQTATRLILPSDAAPDEDAPLDDTVPTPDQLLDQALADLDESTEVTVGTDARVAGRDVYELILEPRSADTLVGEVRFAIDGENGTALAASVTAHGESDPAFETAFTQVDFSAPDASVFAFSPGSEFTIAEKDFSAVPTAPEHDGTHADASPVVIGEGWSTVAELSAPAGTAGDVFAGLDPEQLALLETITTAVEGGRAVQTSLVSVLITDDGRVLAGAVPISRLVEAAQTGR